MRKILSAISVIIFANSCASSQSNVSKAHMDHLKNATVKIIVNHGQSTGTGFFIDKSGVLVTCFHVISEFARDPSATYEAQFENGEKVPLAFTVEATVAATADSMIAYDFVLMRLQAKPRQDFDVLAIGNWSSVKEGDEIITCGYPFQVEQPIISQGILSTKFDELRTLNTNHGSFLLPEQSAWIDVRVNRGNSGGAAILPGSSPEQDKVIGIIDFNLNPMADSAHKLAAKIQKNSQTMTVEIMGVSVAETSFFMTQVAENMSFGVGGCNSIEYLKKIWKGQ